MSYGAPVTALPARALARWACLLLALAAVWLVNPGNVPLYDGVGFEDEPYRYVPVRDATLPPATPAEVTLRLVDGVNPGGLVANSLERGPQVSFFAPPQAFRVPVGATELVARAEPVVPERPAPPGILASNTYRLTFTAGGAAATLRREAQSPAITMRADLVEPPLPAFWFRGAPTEPWRRLETQRIGVDIFSTKAPAAGEFVLSRVESREAEGGGPNAVTLLLIGGGVALVAGALVAVRLAGRRAEQ